MKPAIVRLNINPVAGQEEAVRKALLTRLNAWENEAIKPILLRWLRAQFDLEVMLAVYDFTSFDELLFDVVRSIEGVAGTHSHVMYDGFFFAGGMVMAENARQAGTYYAEAVIDIKAAPGRDREVFAALYDLSEADDLLKYFLFKDIGGHEADMSLQIVSTDPQNIENYVQIFVRAIDGVQDTMTTFSYGWALLMDFTAFMELQAQFSPA